MKYDGIKSRKQKRRKRNAVIGIAILILSLIVIAIIMIGNQQKKQIELAEEKKEAQRVQEAEIENVKELLDQCYATLLPEDSVMQAVDINEQSFAQWLLKNLLKDDLQRLLNVAKDGELTETEIYDSTGETLHVNLRFSICRDFCKRLRCLA